MWGRLHLEGLRVLAIDFTEVEARLGRPLPVVLGIDAFRKSVVDIDYPGHRVAFRDVEAFAYEGAGRAVALHEFGNGMFAVDVQVEGSSPGRMMLDTGSNGTLGVEGAFARAEELLEGRTPSSVVRRGGVGGWREERIATVRTVSFGGSVLRDVPIRFQADDGGEVKATQRAGTLGAGLLCRYRVIFDSTRKRMILEASSEAVAAPFRRDRSGLQTIWEDDGLRVDFVAPGGPAEAAGWTEGMHIRAVDGVAIGPDYWKERHRWPYRAAGTAVVLRDGEGVDRELVLADYY